MAVPRGFCCVRKVNRNIYQEGLTSSRVFSAIILWIPMPTPSITASKHAHPIAEFRAAFIPPRTASAPPVKNPAMTVHVSIVSLTLIQTNPFRNIIPHPFNSLHPLSNHPPSHSAQAGALTSIIRILLLPNPLNRTIKRAKQPPPHPKIPSKNRSSRFDSREGADATFAVRRVTKTFHAVPDCATDALKEYVSVFFLCQGEVGGGIERGRS